jgi:CDP-diglyceride synthetase
MLLKRTLVALVLLPAGLWAIYQGGAVFTAVVTVILALAAWEYVHLFRLGGLQPAGLLVLAGTVALVVSRALNGFQSADWLISLLILASMAYHLVAYERGRDQAGTDFGVTLGGKALT